MEDATSELFQYDFNTEYLTVNPKHVKLPCNEEDLTGISGLKTIPNPFKMMNIADNKNIIEVGLVASR